MLKLRRLPQECVTERVLFFSSPMALRRLIEMIPHKRNKRGKVRQRSYSLQPREAGQLLVFRTTMRMDTKPPVITGWATVTGPQVSKEDLQAGDHSLTA